MRRIRELYYSRYRQGARTVVSHELDSFPIIEHLLVVTQPKLIIELGTFYCGLTALFHETDKSMEIHTFDHYDHMKTISQAKKRITLDELKIFRKKVFGENVKFYKEDVLTKPNQTLIDLLSRPELKLFYCDNGNKPREVKMYAQYLKTGDMLGVHDWGFEIDYTWPGIRETLENFNDFAKINKMLENRKCSSRFFWKWNK